MSPDPLLLKKQGGQSGFPSRQHFQRLHLSASSGRESGTLWTSVEQNRMERIEIEIRRLRITNINPKEK